MYTLLVLRIPDFCMYMLHVLKISGQRKGVDTRQNIAKFAADISNSVSSSKYKYVLRLYALHVIKTKMYYVCMHCKK